MSQSLDGANLYEMFDARLASYAQKNQISAGRKFEEKADPDRLPFQRDRDRILHTKAFRRLKGKMQVVSPAKGDHFRNRLTHTIEVSQIARDLARWLRLNEDLAEAIALAHDLGHPPFGHMGEDALHIKMKEHGLHFEHNEQSLRVVEFFESRHSDFRGLNLTQEVLEGMQKHETFFDRPGGETIYSPHLESQLVDASDEIAYLSADLEDGLRGEFFQLSDLLSLELVSEAVLELGGKDKEDRGVIVRRIIHLLLLQIVSDTQENLKKHSIGDLNDVQQCQEKIVAFHPNFKKKFKALKDFLAQHYYAAPEIETEKKRGQKIISDMFDFLYENPQKIPEDFMHEESLERRICDYIAGMTDSFAEKFLQ